MGNCCLLAPSDSAVEGTVESLEASERSSQAQYVAEHPTHVTEAQSHVTNYGSGNMTPDSIAEPVVSEPTQLEHIADREGKKHMFSNAHVSFPPFCFSRSY